jgi:hypothetical protein
VATRAVRPMTRSEQETQLQIGKLVLEQAVLEKQISKLRDEIFTRAAIFARIGRLLISQPERLVFVGQTVDEQFAGEPAFDRKAMDVDSLIAELRATIGRRKETTVELADLGIDLEEAEREGDLRNSRAIFHPANTRYGPEDSGVKRDEKRSALGFTRPRKKAGYD